MKKLLLYTFLLFTLSLFSQQSITICEENQTIFTYSTGTDQIGNYYWYINGVEQTTNNSSIEINWQNYPFGIYTLEVWFESQFGCNALPVIYTVTTNECNNSTMYTPNAFTPDGDQHNNVWLPIGYNWKEIHYIIFNRWGEVIFESYNGNVGWDGKYTGRDCQEGVYIYKLSWIDKKDVRYIKYGHITLLR
jgi:gliding motility-associated-like protein